METGRYINGLGKLKVRSLSDLHHGEFMCTECKSVIKETSLVIKNDSTDRLSVNGINFCSSICRKNNRLGYDRIMVHCF